MAKHRDLITATEAARLLEIPVADLPLLLTRNPYSGMRALCPARDHSPASRTFTLTRGTCEQVRKLKD